MGTLPDYASKTFLLIDDERFMLGFVDRILQQCKAGRVLRATSGASALALFSGDIGKVDCIIADLHMQPMNGLELLKAIRTGVSKRIPRDQRVIMLTGERDMDAVRAAGELGVNGYVMKPATLENLVTALEAALGRPSTVKEVDDYHAVQLPDLSVS
jgi:DNA-binding NarL/FixJ family response regulator